MKKILFLLVTLLLTAAIPAFAQLGVGQQFANNNFESWRTEATWESGFIWTTTHTSVAPNNWHSINDATGGLVGSARSENFVTKITASPGGSGSYCVQLQCVSKLGIPANGGLSSGRFNAASITVTDPVNCTYTTTNSGYNQTLTAYPDSVYIWTKTSISNSSHNARINIVLHSNTTSSGSSYNAIYQDPNGSDVAGSNPSNNSKVVAMATLNFRAQGSWVKQKIAFDYNTYITNNATPAYILATFSTNMTAGTGSEGDKLWIDDVVLIYNTRLATLKVNNVPITGFNADVLTYNVPMCAGSAFPTITATCQSSHATATITHAATQSEPYTLVKVTHLNQESNDAVSKVYRINYNVVTPQAPTFASSSVNKCSGVVLPITATVASGYTCKWYTQSEGGSSVFTGTTFNCQANASTTYYVSSYNTSAGCESQTRTPITVNVIPTPAAPTLAGASHCGAGEVTLAVQNPNDDYVYTWKQGNTQVATGTTYTPNLQATTSYTVTASNNGCVSSASNVTATIKSVPAAPTLAGASHCGAGEVTLAVQNPNDDYVYTWKQGGTQVATGTTYTPNLQSSTTYTVTAIYDACESSPSEVTATIYPMPAAPTMATTQPVCPGNDITLSVSNPVGTYTYNWYSPVSVQVIHTGVSYTIEELAQETSLIVKAVSENNCISEGSNVTAQVHELPSSPNASCDPVCLGETVILHASLSEGMQARWYNVAEGGVSLSSQADFSVDNLSVGTHTYYVSQYNPSTACEGSRASVSATVKPIPTQPAVANVARCGEGSVELTVSNAVQGPSYQWFAAAEGGEALHTGSIFTTPSVDATTTYYVQATELGCSSARTSANAVINAIPAAPMAQNAARCGNGSVVLNAQPAENCVCKWYDSQEQAIISGLSDNDNVLTTSNLQSGNYTYNVKSYNETTNCYSENKVIEVVVSPNPGMPTASSAARCGAGDVELTAQPGNNANTCRWYNANDELLATTTSYTAENLEATTSFKLSSYNSETGCESSKSNVSAIINLIPAVPTVSGNAPLCGSGSLQLLGSTGDPVSVCRWVSGNDTTISNNFNTGVLTQTTNYQVQSYNQNTQCASDFINVEAVVRPIPAMATLEDQSRCGTGALTLTISNYDANNTYTWYKDNNVVNTGETYNIENLQNTTTYNVVTTLNGCSSSASSVTATIIPIPAVPTTLGDVICGSGEVTLSVVQPGNDAYYWYADEESTEVIGQGTQFVVENLNQTTNYYVDATYQGCVSARASATAVVNPNPAKPVVYGDTVLCAGNATTLTATSDAVADHFTWHYFQVQSEGAQYTTPELNQSTWITVVASNTETQCESEATLVNITVNARPSNPQISNAERCGAGNATLAVVAPEENVTYKWYNADEDSVGVGTQFEAQNLEATATYHVYAFSAQGCRSNDMGSAQIVINPIPANAELDDVELCEAGNVILNVKNIINNYTYNWYEAAQGGEAIYQGSSYNANIVASPTTYYVSVMTGQGCVSESRTAVTATIKGNPSAPVVADVTRCGNGNVTLKVTNPNQNYVYNWYAEIQGGEAVRQDTIMTVLNLEVGNSVQYFVSVSVGNCESERTMATATAYAVPTAPTVSGKSRCGVGEITLTAVAGTDATTCRWYDSSSVIINTGLDYEIEDLNYTSQFGVSSYNEQTGCESNKRNVVATVNPIPSVPEVSGNDALCGSGTRNLTATPGSNATICRWFIGNDTIVSNNYQTENLTQTTNYQVQSYNALTNCVSENVDVAVVVNEIPAAPAVASDTVCQGTQISLQAVAATGHTCRWFDQPQGVFPIATGNEYQPENLTVGTTVFYVDQQNDETLCASSRVPVYAVVYPTYRVDDPQVACDSYTWNNETFTESGNYERTLTTVNGCDSVVTLQLTINRSKVTNIDTTVCDVFVWNGQDYTESADLRGDFYTTNLCDSTVNIHLTVKHSSLREDHIYLCSNEIPYNYHDLMQVTESGTFALHTLNAEGCDSTIMLTVTINAQPAVATNITPAVRCGAGNVTLSAQVGAHGSTCRWYAAADDTNPIFEGSQLSIQNLNETTSYYVSSYNNYNGHPCESARQEVTATINAIPAEPLVDAEYRCGDGTVDFEADNQGENITCRWYLTANANTPQATALAYSPTVVVDNGTTSFYVESYNISNTCKSARIEVMATAYQIPQTPTFEAMSNCGPKDFQVGAPTSGYYNWYDSMEGELIGQGWTSTGMVSESRSFFISNAVDYQNIICESGRGQLALTIYPVYQPQNIFDTICQGDTYQQHGISETFDQAGEYERVINRQSSNGCDSLVTLVLFVKEKRSYEFTEVACDSYEWNGETFTQSGDIVRHFTSSIGCDSTVTLHLTINKSQITEFSKTACDAYTWNDETYTETGNYVQHFQTVHSCDSAVTLHLTINKSQITEFSKTACDAYTWNNETYTQSGNYEQSFQTVHGCDSTVTLHLTINHSDDIHFADVVCAGVPYDDYGFDTTITVAGTYTLVHHNVNAKNCDSTTTLTLTVNPIYVHDVTMTICETALPFTWNDVTYPIGTPSGDYEHTYYGHTILGCDSTVTLHLTISNKYVTRLNKDICEGNSYHFSGKDLTETGVYYDTLMAVNLCDSIVILNLTVHQLNTTYLEAALCQGEDYHQYGFHIISPEVGTRDYTQHVQTSFGCDSTIVLTLTVNPRFYEEEEAEVCDNETYVWQGHNVRIGRKAAGSYVIWDSLSTAQGCDSVYKLNLTVNPTYYREENALVCDNEAYVWTGHQVQIPMLPQGVYTYWDSLETISGCDSVFKLMLTVKPTYYFEENGTTCDNEAYVWAGHNVQIGVLEAGTHIIWDRLQTALYGCDSIYKLTLTVHPSYIFSEQANVCANEAYVWQGHEKQIGILPVATHVIWDSLQTIHSCDSVYKLTLTVTPTYYFEENGTSCDDQEYVWAGHQVQIGMLEAGNYIFWDSLQTINGCDSVYKLNLVIRPTKESEFTVSICEGEVYQYNRRNYSVSGDYEHHFQTALACDSMVTLHLIVNPTYNIDTNINICQGALPYYFADTMFTEAGRKTVYLHTQQGCDSIYNVSLMVTPFITASESVTICDDEVPYRYKDSIFYVSGVYEVIETSADGCNKITTLTLTVNPTYNITIVDTACGSYSVNRITHVRTFTESGVYTDTLRTISGCDSVVTYDLTIYPLKDSLLTPVICEGESYVENGFSIITPQAGIVLDTLHSQCVGTGCDSTVYLMLTVNPSYNQHFDTTVCDEFVWNDITYTESALLSHTYTLATGCDSTVNINLTVNHSKSTWIDTVVCDQFVCPWIFTHVITESGVLTHTYTTEAGCDSTVTINLTVNKSVSQNEQLTLCQSDLPYTWRDTTFSTTTPVGIQNVVFHRQTVNGCDSTVTLLLTVNPNYIHNENPVTFCQGESYTWNGQVITETGVYTDTVPNDFGCYDVYVLNVTVNPTYLTAEFDTICSNELPYAWRGLSVIRAGVTEKTYPTALGCDSIFVLNLTVNPTKETTLTPLICQGESYIENGFTIITPQAGMVYDTLHSHCIATGCDSTVYLRLTVNPTYDLTFEGVICLGERYQENDFDTIPETPGTHVVVKSLTTAAGCDSIRTLTLTVNPTYHITIVDTVCGSYSVNRITHVLTFTESGVYTDTLRTINGCDSVVTYDLTIYPLKDSLLTPVICEGESYVENGFSIITPQAGIVLDTLHSQCVGTGCDSTVYLLLTVNPSYNQHFDTTVCDEFVWNDITYTESALLSHTYTLATGCDSTVNINLTVNHSKSTWIDTVVCDQFVCPWIFTHVITESGVLSHTYTAENGCDSTVTINLTVNKSVSQNEQLTLCQSDLPYTWRDTTFSTTTPVGIQNVVFHRQTVNGCDSIVTLLLTINPNAHYQDNPYIMCQGESYDWRNLTITESGVYTDTVANDFGCYDVYSIEVTVNPTYRINEYDVICDNELPYTWRGQVLTAAGEREVRYPTMFGCDSIYHLYLTVNPTYFFPETAEICSNESLTWHGQQISGLNAGTYTYWDSLQTGNTCDSVYRLTLTVNPIYFFEESASMCDNGIYVWEGHNRTFEDLDAGTYTYWDSLQTARGCDSVYKLNLTVNPSYSFYEEDAVCENETYVWAGHDVEISWTQAGTYVFTDHQYTAMQCDSVYVLSLTVNPTAHSIETASNCSNEEAYVWHNMELTQTGTYFDTLATVQGCDSVCQMNFTLLNPSAATFADTTCVNAEYTGYGFELTNLTVGDTTVQRIIDNVVGCDSTITLNLHVKPLSYGSFDAIACQGYLWNNQYYTESGQYQQTFVAANGCDSIVTLNLIVDQPVSDTLMAVSCDFYEWDGTLYYQSGVYSKIYPRPVGCDSTAVLMLTVNQSTELNVSDTICLGEYYDRYGFDTMALHVGMMPLQRTDINAAGCDSVIKVNLLVRMTYLTLDTVNTCDNEPYEWQGMICDTTGVYTKVYPAVNGCDSIFILVLNVFPTYEMDVEDTAYVGVPYHNHGLDFTPQSEGTMNIPVTFASVNGCDSLINLTLVVVNGTGIEQVKTRDIDLNLYPNPTDNQFTVTSSVRIKDLTIFANSGEAVLFRNVGDNSAVVEVESLAAGIYYVRLNTEEGMVYKKLIVR